MILSATSQHALRAILSLASGAVEPPVRASELAEAAGVPPNYMGKILHQLVKSGILRSVRGKNGGFELAVPAEELSLLDVVSQFDDLGLEGKCLFGRVECGQNPCSTHDRWAQVAHQVVEFFSSTTIADVL